MTFSPIISRRKTEEAKIWSFPGHKEGEGWHVGNNPCAFSIHRLEKKKVKYETTDKEELEENK